jgi:hypothetical protein
MDKNSKSFRDFCSGNDSSDLPLEESYNKFLTDFRRLCNSGKRYSFKEWLGVFSDLIDDID